jgi:hypothetical protein
LWALQSEVNVMLPARQVELSRTNSSIFAHVSLALAFCTAAYSVVTFSGEATESLSLGLTFPVPTPSWGARMTSTLPAPVCTMSRNRSSKYAARLGSSKEA